MSSRPAEGDDCGGRALPAPLSSRVALKLRCLWLRDGHTRWMEIGPVTLSVTVAARHSSMSRGLGDAPALEEGHGMLFLHRPRSGVTYWMKGMRFPIDIIWIRGHRVIGITPLVEPPAPGTPDEALVLHRAPEASDKAVEVAAGWTRAADISVGDRVSIAWTARLDRAPRSARKGRR